MAGTTEVKGDIITIRECKSEILDRIYHIGTYTPRVFGRLPKEFATNTVAVLELY